MESGGRGGARLGSGPEAAHCWGRLAPYPACITHIPGPARLMWPLSGAWCDLRLFTLEVDRLPDHLPIVRCGVALCHRGTPVRGTWVGGTDRREDKVAFTDSMGSPLVVEATSEPRIFFVSTLRAVPQ